MNIFLQQQLWQEDLHIQPKTWDQLHHSVASSEITNTSGGLRRHWTPANVKERKQEKCCASAWWSLHKCHMILSQCSAWKAWKDLLILSLMNAYKKVSPHITQLHHRFEIWATPTPLEWNWHGSGPLGAVSTTLVGHRRGRGHHRWLHLDQWRMSRWSKIMTYQNDFRYLL